MGLLLKGIVVVFSRPKKMLMCVILLFAKGKDVIMKGLDMKMRDYCQCTAEHSRLNWVICSIVYSFQ